MRSKLLAGVVTLVAAAPLLVPPPAMSTVPRTVFVEETGWAH
jgi:hypothetical protein